MMVMVVLVSRGLGVLTALDKTPAHKKNILALKVKRLCILEGKIKSGYYVRLYARLK